jgi:hypothetical protein
MREARETRLYIWRDASSDEEIGSHRRELLNNGGR